MRKCQSGQRAAGRSEGLLRSPLVPLLLALAALLPLGACRRPAASAPAPQIVTVVAPTMLHYTPMLETTGTVASPQSVDMLARVEGTLEQIAVADGAEVHKGDLLFVIEPLPYLSRLQGAQAAEAQQRAVSRQADAEYSRQASLAQSKVVSGSTLDQALSSRDSARAALAQAQSNTQQAAITYGYTRVFAPFDGVMTTHLANVGQLVGNGNATKLASVVRLDPVWVNFSVPEADVIRIRAVLAAGGHTVRSIGQIPVDVGLQNEAGLPHHGALDYAAPQVDGDSGTLAVRGLLPNPGHVLLPGYFVRVRIPVQRNAEALAVPDEAVGTGQDGPVVLTVGPDGRVLQRSVRLGQLHDGLRVIEAGLAPGDRVILSGREGTAPGDLVSVRPAAEEKTPGGTLAAAPG